MAGGSGSFGTSVVFGASVSFGVSVTGVVSGAFVSAGSEEDFTGSKGEVVTLSPVALVSSFGESCFISSFGCGVLTVSLTSATIVSEAIPDSSGVSILTLDWGASVSWEIPSLFFIGSDSLWEGSVGISEICETSSQPHKQRTRATVIIISVLLIGSTSFGFPLILYECSCFLSNVPPISSPFEIVCWS